LYAAITSSSVFNCVRTSSAVNAALTLVGYETEGPNAIHGTPAMPANVGLLVKPDSTKFFEDDLAIQSLGRENSTGNQLFLLSQHVQFVARDPRAFVEIIFPDRKSLELKKKKD
jgi:hypothetical protein